VTSGFFYKSAEERQKFVSAEREFIDKRVQKVIDLKKKLCDNTNKRFVVVNQKVRCLQCWISSGSEVSLILKL
jgi:T-complex protein 1 subunit zeta